MTHPGEGDGRALGFLPSLDSPSQEVIPEKANVASAAPPPPESPASMKPSSSPCELASTGVPRSRHRRHGRHKGPEKMRHGDCRTERLTRGGRWRLWTERWTGGAGRRRGGPRPRPHTLADAARGPHSEPRRCPSSASPCEQSSACGLDLQLRLAPPTSCPSHAPFPVPGWGHPGAAC